MAGILAGVLRNLLRDGTGSSILGAAYTAGQPKLLKRVEVEVGCGCRAERTLQPRREALIIR